MHKWETGQMSFRPRAQRDRGQSSGDDHEARNCRAVYSVNNDRDTFVCIAKLYEYDENYEITTMRCGYVNCMFRGLTESC